ncbi:MAG: FKBP-type peptidyl-prolyl cis-trans isomerase FkpA [Parcubacteria group bacterium Gr01-1014_46]|nr:MAG: FKBP-type peptidyl-prolyl cis-trans isomerase FkpA [Parcubacteria group bacterium Gr01-1014_46]
MKKLSKNEWVAVVVSVFIVGFFFIFGQGLVSMFSKTNESTAQTSQIMGQDIVVGTGEEAKTGSRVVVHYTGKFTDGNVFDSSVTRGEPFQFVLGSGQVIKGWDEGLVGMRVGGKRIVVVPPELGYGYQDYGPIPAGSTLIFEIELLKVE